MLRVFRFLALTGMETRALDTRLSLRVWAYGFQCTGYSSNKSNRLPVAYILTTSRIDRLHLTPVIQTGCQNNSCANTDASHL